MDRHEAATWGRYYVLDDKVKVKTKKPVIIDKVKGIQGFEPGSYSPPCNVILCEERETKILYC